MGDNGWVVGGWVGGKSFKSEKKGGKLGGGWGKNKVPKKKMEIREKKNWEGGEEKIKLQKKIEIRAKKG